MCSSIYTENVELVGFALKFLVLRELGNVFCCNVATFAAFAACACGSGRYRGIVSILVALTADEAGSYHHKSEKKCYDPCCCFHKHHPFFL